MPKTSIEKALEHSGTHLSAKLNLHWIDTTQIDPADTARIAAALEPMDAVIVPGGFGARGTETKIGCVRYCREAHLPYLGICLGFQMAVLEFARNVCGLEDAHSTEFKPDAKNPLISELPEQKKVEGLGGTMRLGGKDVALRPSSMASWLYDNRTTIRERFRHRYEVEPRYIEAIEKAGLQFTGRHPSQPIMQVLELPTSVHPYFVGAQFHPELTSRPLHPAPMFLGLVAAAIRHAYPLIPADEITTRWLRSEPKPAAPAAAAR